jgi:hypothetical protein
VFLWLMSSDICQLTLLQARTRAKFAPEVIDLCQSEGHSADLWWFSAARSADQTCLVHACGNFARRRSSVVSADVRLWLQADVRPALAARPLCPSKQTYRGGLTASHLIRSALPPKADVIGGGAGCPLLTQSGHWCGCAAFGTSAKPLRSIGRHSLAKAATPAASSDAARHNAVQLDYLGSGRSDGSEDSPSSAPNGLK